MTYLLFINSLGVDKEDSFFGTERVINEMRRSKEWPNIVREVEGNMAKILN